MGEYFLMKLGTMIVNYEGHLFARSLFRSRSNVKVTNYKCVNIYIKRTGGYFLMKLGTMIVNWERHLFTRSFRSRSRTGKCKI